MGSLFAFITGLLFGLGLIVSGLVNPAKILGFLDIAGKWDPSLALVMAGAVSVGLVAFAVARRRTSSVLGLSMPSPPAQSIDARLVAAASCSASGGALPAFARAPRSLRSVPVTRRRRSSCSPC